MSKKPMYIILVTMLLIALAVSTDTYLNGGGFLRIAYCVTVWLSVGLGVVITFSEPQ